MDVNKAICGILKYEKVLGYAISNTLCKRDSTFMHKFIYLYCIIQAEYIVSYRLKYFVCSASQFDYALGPGWKTCIKSATRSCESIKLISCELRVIFSYMTAASQRRLNAFSRQRQLLNLYERYANACMVIVRLITHVTHTNDPFFDLSPKFMIRSRVNLDASKANLSC